MDKDDCGSIYAQFDKSEGFIWITYNLGNSLKPQKTSINTISCLNGPYFHYLRRNKKIALPFLLTFYDFLADVR